MNAEARGEEAFEAREHDRRSGDDDGSGEGDGCPGRPPVLRRINGISSYLECWNRRRRVVLDARIARSDNDAGHRRRPSEALVRRLTEESDAPKLPEREREREGMPDSLGNGDQESDFDQQESTAERDSHRRSPTELELEGFFAETEGELRRRFAYRYNFDVADDAPLAGRFEWIPLTHESE